MGLLESLKNMFTAPAEQGPVQPGAAPLSKGGLLTQFQDKLATDPDFKKGLMSFGANMLQSKDPSFSSALGGGLQAYQASRDASAANTLTKKVKESDIAKQNAAIAKEEKAAKGIDAYVASTSNAVANAPPEIQAAVAPYLIDDTVGSKESADAVNKILGQYQNTNQQQTALDKRQKIALGTVPAGTQANIDAANARQNTALNTVPAGTAAIIDNQAAQGAANRAQREELAAAEPAKKGKIHFQEKLAEEAITAPDSLGFIDSQLGTLNKLLDPKREKILRANTGNYAWYQGLQGANPEGAAAQFSADLDQVKSSMFLLGAKALAEKGGLNTTEDKVVSGIMSSLKQSQSPKEVTAELKKIKDLFEKAKARKVKIMSLYPIDNAPPLAPPIAPPMAPPSNVRTTASGLTYEVL